ncbi:uncharacterized protein LOC107873844 [Capsicum annuum]|uniref:uncharacterized protein LOC107873844 n=1 Tax=Capsicum annuum TaxID=4072 RepID=UPI0007BF9663|nr:uncharacterized protein LOC107873844 [Capsicum annuum]
MGFKKYSELIGHLLVAEQHNDLLIKNNETRPPSTALFPGVNAVNFHPTWRERNSDPSRGRGQGRGRGHGRYFNQGNRLAINNSPQHQQCKKKGKTPEAAPRMNPENICYRCGGKGHWARTCRMPKHLVKLYQASLKKPENDVETNFLLENNVEPMDLEVSGFFAVLEEFVNHLVGDNNAIIRLC